MCGAPHGLHAGTFTNVVKKIICRLFLGDFSLKNNKKEAVNCKNSPPYFKFLDSLFLLAAYDVELRHNMLAVSELVYYPQHVAYIHADAALQSWLKCHVA